MPALLSLAVRTLLILAVTVRDMTIIKDKSCFCAHVWTCPESCISPSQLSCSKVFDTSLQRRRKIFVNYHFRIALQSLPVPQTPKILWLCFIFLYVNVQRVEGIQKGAWGECGVPSWFWGTIPFSRRGFGGCSPMRGACRQGRAHLPHAEGWVGWWAGGRVNRIAILWIKKDKYPFRTRSANFEV